MQDAVVTRLHLHKIKQDLESITSKLDAHHKFDQKNVVQEKQEKDAQLVYIYNTKFEKTFININFRYKRFKKCFVFCLSCSFCF